MHEPSFEHAVELQQQGRLTEAEQLYREVLRLRPDHVAAYINHGAVLFGLGRYEAAIATYEQGIGFEPGSAELHYGRGVALHVLVRPEEALESYGRAIALRPDLADAYGNRAQALLELQRPAEALPDCDVAIALRPDFATDHARRAWALSDLHRLEEAVASYDRAIALQPGDARAYSNRGDVLQKLQRLDEALASIDQAIALQPDFADAHCNRGVVMQDLDRLEDAMASYHRAVALRPNFAQARYNNSLCLLKLGELARGWDEYEWRWQGPQREEGLRLFGRPLWHGTQDLAGKTILLHAEQGYGDTLQFCRYALLAAERGARVVLEVQRPLVRLLQSLGVGPVVAAGDPLPPFDLHCPLLSLPLAFRTVLETIPGVTPYLGAEPNAVAAWRERLAGLPGLRVGLVWAGAARHASPEAMAIDRRRSTTLRQLAPLATVPAVSFVSLQKGAPVDDLGAPVDLVPHDFIGELTDFADTAALVAALDLVISVDTAVAHLAGALGKPVWILNRFDACWRWLTERTDSPWYPTARLFRQPAPGDWDSVINEVRAALSRVT